MAAWLSAFIVTQLVECPLYARALAGRPRRWAIAFGASLFTHPIVFFVFPQLGIGGYWATTSLAEAFAVLAEAAWLTKFGVRHSVAWALAANGLSLGIGLCSRAWFGWP